MDQHDLLEVELNTRGWCSKCQSNRFFHPVSSLCDSPYPARTCSSCAASSKLRCERARSLPKSKTNSAKPPTNLEAANRRSVEQDLQHSSLAAFRAVPWIRGRSTLEYSPQIGRVFKISGHAATVRCVHLLSSILFMPSETFFEPFKFPI